MLQFSQVCAFTAQTVWKHSARGHPAHREAILNSWMPVTVQICNPLVEQLRYSSVENHFARKRTFADSAFSVRLQNYSLRIKYAGLVGQYNCYSMRQATKGHKFHASMEIYDLVERKTPKNSHFKKNERIWSIFRVVEVRSAEQSGSI